ncbi:hypothetical protein [Roseovarius aquimarinus]|uniref:Dihydroxy-acid dehydratase n=1 Tax=Roseovarius aquimarinus TaxID=1229156 RepID=A0ABW7I9E7_9RHOB
MILSLAACIGGEGISRVVPESETRTEAPRRIAFYSGDVVVAGPEGYCVDVNSIQKGGGAAFALLANCGHLGTLFADDVPPAVVTVSVLARDGRAEQPSAERLARAWKNAGVTRMVNGDGISLIQLARGGDSLLPGGDPRHWRGAMLINGHMIGLAAYGGTGSGLHGKAGHDLLVATAEAMLSGSPHRRAVPPPAPRPEAPQSTAPEDAAEAPRARPRTARPQTGLNSFLAGLFRDPA